MEIHPIKFYSKEKLEWYNIISMAFIVIALIIYISGMFISFFDLTSSIVCFASSILIMILGCSLLVITELKYHILYSDKQVKKK